MHGLINRAIQCFVVDTYGHRLWAGISQEVGLGPYGFEAMLTYDDALTQTVLRRAAEQLGKPETALLEDLGTYLCTGPDSRLRRLLRFGGGTFEEFLHSLDDLPDRARLALPDLDMPALELTDLGEGCYWLLVRHRLRRSTMLISGILRAMADDYGALVLLEPLSSPKYLPDGAPLEGALDPAATATGQVAPRTEPWLAREPGDATPGQGGLPPRYITVIEIRLLDTSFHQGRSFALAAHDDSQSRARPFGEDAVETVTGAAAGIAAGPEAPS